MLILFLLLLLPYEVDALTWFFFKKKTTFRALKPSVTGHAIFLHPRSALVRWSNRRENLLATGGADGRVILWDVRRAGSFLAALDYNNISRKAGSSRGSRKRAADSAGNRYEIHRFDKKGEKRSV